MTKNTYTIIAVIIIILVAGLVWWSGAKKEQMPAGQETTQQAIDTTDVIQKDFASIVIGDVKEEFKDVDGVIKSL